MREPFELLLSSCASRMCERRLFEKVFPLFFFVCISHPSETAPSSTVPLVVERFENRLRFYCYLKCNKNSLLSRFYSSFACSHGASGIVEKVPFVWACHPHSGECAARFTREFTPQSTTKGTATKKNIYDNNVCSCESSVLTVLFLYRILILCLRLPLAQ